MQRDQKPIWLETPKGGVDGAIRGRIRDKEAATVFVLCWHLIGSRGVTGRPDLQLSLSCPLWERALDNWL
jgi:hypothetical protein